MTNASFVGLDNFVKLLGTRRSSRRPRNTAYFVVVGVPLTLVGGLAGDRPEPGHQRLRTLFRVGYYLPVITSIVAIAVVWRFVLNPDQGLVNALLQSAGINGPDWLADPALAMPSIIVMAVWRNLGFAMVVFLAGLQTIPATRLRGGPRWTAPGPLAALPLRDLADARPGAPVMRDP